MDGGRGATEMNCDEAELLLHALIDGELDAGHAREVEAHVAGCPRCAAALRDYRVMRQALAAPALRDRAPAGLRARIEGTLPSPRVAPPPPPTPPHGPPMATLPPRPLAPPPAPF